MKNFILLIGIFFCTSSMFAQLELKLNGLSTITANPEVSGEYLFTQRNIGVETSLRAGIGGSEMRIAAKSYFTKDNTASKFYAGFYLGFEQGSRSTSSEFIVGNSSGDGLSPIAGLTIGYKNVSPTGIIFEVAGGAGRSFLDGGRHPDAFASVSIGYRFYQ